VTKPTLEQSRFEIWFGSAVDIWRAANPDVTVGELLDALETLRRKLTDDRKKY